MNNYKRSVNNKVALNTKAVLNRLPGAFYRLLICVLKQNEISQNSDSKRNQCQKTEFTF